MNIGNKLVDPALLFLVNARRLFVERLPLSYEPGYWSMALPPECILPGTR